MTLLIYRIFYCLGRILITVLQPVLPSELRTWVALRNQNYVPQHSFANSTIWFHAASGEIEYCKSVIRLIKKRYPSENIVVTYSSPSAEKLFHNIQNEVDLFMPLPWDQPSPLKELLRQLKPKVLIFSRTDIWPELLHQVRRQGIKTGVISYYPRLKNLNLPFVKWILAQLDFISCLDEQTKNRLKIITDTPITADGDTRFDQVFHRLAHPSKLSIQNKKYWVCGSTWPEDEDILLPTFRSALEQDYKIVLCPHEVSSHNLSRLKSEVSRNGFTCSFLSEYGNAQDIEIRTDVLIVDRIGYLADCYRQAALAFVGGSFKDKVHSVMEPLCCGLPVLVGPHYRNNPEAVRYHGTFVMSVQNAEQLKSAINSITPFEKQSIIEVMKKNQYASEKVLHLITGSFQEKSNS